MEENNWLPSLDDNEISPEARSYLLDPSKDYPEPYYLLEFNGVPFSPLGGIQAISGQKKNGKSFVLTQLMAAVLGQDSERQRCGGRDESAAVFRYRRQHPELSGSGYSLRCLS